MQPQPFSPDGQRLIDNLRASDQPQVKSKDTVHVDDVGGSIYFAYEQLRNAAEYSEQHLLLRRSIERFLQRSMRLTRYEPVGRELVIELTQSRYLKNDSISREIIDQIDDSMRQFVELYNQLRINNRQRQDGTIRKWVLQVASVHLEQLVVPQPRTGAFVDFLYQHYLGSIDRSQDEIDKNHYRVAVYCAVHRTIMKSDIATTRAYALSAQIIDAKGKDGAVYFYELCEMIDGIFQGRVANRLVRLINQHGAPMRILREIVITNSNAIEVLNNRSRMLDRVHGVTLEQYAQVRQRLNKGIIRSVAFIAITKILIGVALEVPYDLVRNGYVFWRPLLINVLFPPLYMATLGLSIRNPSRANTQLIEATADRILYKPEQPMKYRLRRRVSSSALNNTFNILYAVTFTVWMVSLGWLLHVLGFNTLSGIIFFIFLSTVSFLGFRLMQTAREYEMIEARRGAWSVLADFFYTPFIRIGYWIADKYARINVVARVLDILIEMPLKFVLRFVQQWVSFLRDKQEEL